MAQHSSLAASEDRCHPPPLQRKARVSDRVDALVDPMQMTLLDPSGNRRADDSRLFELSAADDPVLPGSDLANGQIAIGAF
jgi:hypothetical protein